ncbi:hypothetical protein IW261DRAFT_1655232 [Armillaria novae-zelandiae]|uniref:Uncharacterized protein n=1 Tax=Armillaria novae-zelandiae TaxID=153914 RepID=A0AA39PNV6_9AGAR|nr:hypothetical protein IW261DRAFT_1655232 [Armillaria novae-zelandiae]
MALPACTRLTNTELKQDGFISLYPRLCRHFEGLLKHATLAEKNHIVFWWGHWIGCWRGAGGDSELELKHRRKSARVQDHAPSPSSHAIRPVTCPKSPQARRPVAYVFWTSTSDWTYTGLAVGDRGLAASNSSVNYAHPRARTPSPHKNTRVPHQSRPSSYALTAGHASHPLARVSAGSPSLPLSCRRRLEEEEVRAHRWDRWSRGWAVDGKAQCYVVEEGVGDTQRGDGADVRTCGRVRGRAGRAWDWGRREGGPSCGGEGDGMGGTAEVLCEACACLSMAETAVRCQSETTRGVSLMSTCLSMADTPTDTVDMRVGWQVEALKEAAQECKGSGTSDGHRLIAAIV